jgi:two-component system sensor histidine kinase KdpD
LVRLALKDLERELAGRAVFVRIEESLAPVKMDFVLTQQCLNNLLLNAAVHTPSGTPIELRVFTERQDLVLSVADRGPGLATEALTAVFNKFYRAPSAPPGGTGLGLAIVKGFVEAQGGRVAVENRPGGGAVFSVHLPLVQAPPIAAEIPR